MTAASCTAAGWQAGFDSLCCTPADTPIAATGQAYAAERGARDWLAAVTFHALHRDYSDTNQRSA